MIVSVIKNHFKKKKPSKIVAHFKSKFDAVQLRTNIVQNWNQGEISLEGCALKEKEKGICGNE